MSSTPGARSGQDRVFSIPENELDQVRDDLKALTEWHLEAFALAGVRYRIVTRFGPVVWLVPEASRKPTERIEVTPQDLTHYDPRDLLARIQHLHDAQRLLGGGTIERLAGEEVGKP